MATARMMWYDDRLRYACFRQQRRTANKNCGGLSINHITCEGVENLVVESGKPVVGEETCWRVESTCD